MGIFYYLYKNMFGYPSEKQREARKHRVLKKNINDAVAELIDTRPKTSNGCGELIVVIYNFIMTIVWIFFAVAYFTEVRESGIEKAMRHPRSQLSLSISMLRVCQYG